VKKVPEDTWDLALFPLNTVLFPGMELPLHIFEDRYRLMINECLAGNRDFGVLMASVATEDDGVVIGQAVGTSARITHVERLEDGCMDILTTAMERFRVLQLLRTKPYLVGRVEGFPFEEADSPLVTELTPQVAALFTQYLRLAGEVLGNLIQIGTMPRDATGLACTIAMSLQVSLSEKQQLLAIRTLPRLLWAESLIMGREVTLLKRMRQVQESNAGYVSSPTGYLSLS
jgi:Lon protease-like protein